MVASDESHSISRISEDAKNHPAVQHAHYLTLLLSVLMCRLDINSPHLGFGDFFLVFLNQFLLKPRLKKKQKQGDKNYECKKNITNSVRTG